MSKTQEQQNALSQFSAQLAATVEQAARSIVTVAARQRQSASGILWRAETETIILTADHVIEREEDITVGLPDGHEVKAQLIGRDPRLLGTVWGTVIGGSAGIRTQDQRLKRALLYQLSY